MHKFRCCRREWFDVKKKGGGERKEKRSRKKGKSDPSSKNGLRDWKNITVPLKHCLHSDLDLTSLLSEYYPSVKLVIRFTILYFAI